MKYLPQSKTRARVTFRDAAGALADPTTVTLRVQSPAALAAEVVHSYPPGVSIVRESIGVYYVDVTLDVAGTWKFRWLGTGAVGATDECTVRVEKSLFATT